MSELSRVEDLLTTGVEEPVLPMSRLEAILRGEKITPQSRVEELLLQYNPSDILIEKRITANGTYFAVNDNADGYFKVVVDTPVVPPTVLDHLVETITTNGLHEYTPTHDGFDTAAITVNVQPSVGTKTITENNTYNASDEGLDGYSQVTVNVSGGQEPIIGTLDIYGNGKYNSEGVVNTFTNTLTIPEIASNSFAHIDISEMESFTKFIIYCRFPSSGGGPERCEAVVSNIPTFTPTQQSDYINMLLIYSWNSSNQIYISKDSTGIWIGKYGSMELTNASYEYEKEIDYFSSVNVNISRIDGYSNSENIKETWNSDRNASTTYYLDEPIYENGSEHLITDLRAMYFSGSNSYTSTTSVSIANNVELHMSWGAQSGSSRQQLRVYYIKDISKIKVLSDWTVYNDSNYHEFVIPNEAKSLGIDDFFIDFKEVVSGGYSIDTTNVEKKLEDGKLVIKIPIASPASVKCRIVYVLPTENNTINADNIQISTTEHTFITNDLDVPMSTTGNGWYLLGVSGYANGEYQEHYFPFYWNGSAMDVETWQYPSGYSWRSYVHITDTTIGIPTDYNGDWRNQYAQVTKLENYQLCNDNS